MITLIFISGSVGIVAGLLHLYIQSVKVKSLEKQGADFRAELKKTISHLAIINSNGKSARIHEVADTGTFIRTFGIRKGTVATFFTPAADPYKFDLYQVGNAMALDQIANRSKYHSDQFAYTDSFITESRLIRREKIRVLGA
ncbi:MAG: hypothetical protein V2B15_08205 [Bacteroidota bacterium]